MELERDLVERMLVDGEASRRSMRLVSMTRGPLVGPMENYCSELVRLDLMVETASGRTDHRRLVAKGRLEDPNRDFNLPALGSRSTHSFLACLCDTEIIMFKHLLPKIGSLLEAVEKPQDTSLWAWFYGSNRDTIFLEDLSDSGYKLVERGKFLDLGHAMLVIRGLARLHCASKVLLDRKELDVDLLGRPEEKNLVFGDNSPLNVIISNAWRLTLEEVRSRWPQWVPVAEKMSKTECFNRKYLELRSEDPEVLEVLNHGDAWKHNVMFKYRANQPESVKLVDFQMSHHSSLGWDLSCFLFTCLSPAAWESDLPTLVDAYCEEYSSCLHHLSPTAPVSAAPTASVVFAELSRLSFFSLTSSIYIYPAVISVHKVRQANPFNNPRFLDILPAIFTYFEKSGWFDKL